MSNLSSSGSRKKPRAKENKTPSVRERQRSSVLLQSALMPAIVESAGVISSPDAPYVCSGKFVVDFLQLCRRSALSYVPNVVARPRRPSAPASLGDEKRSTGFTSKQGSKLPSIQTAALYAAADQALTSDAVEVFIPEPPPRTYLLRDPISFFRPSVQADVDKADKSVLVDQAAFVTEIYIRGWKVDDVMMGILADCIPAVTSLHTIDFWNVGLTDVTLARLASVIPRCRTLRTLVLDANYVPSQRWNLLLQDDSPLLQLSLRYCGITSLGAKYLGQSLGCATHQNTRLVSLDLAGNHISDGGASFLADALRLNRTLLVLNLAGNGISDVGAIKLARVLSTFELTHDEVVERRRLHYASRLRAEAEARRRRRSSIGKLSRRKSSTPTATGLRSRKRLASPAERTDHGKPLKSKASKSPRTPLADDVKLKEKRSGTRLKKSASSQLGRGVESSESSQALDQALPSSAHPLLSAVVLRESTVANPTTLIRGNRSLISLNLCRNDIGEAGLTALLDAVLPLSVDPVPDATMPGILRITVHNNGVARGKSAARSSVSRRSTTAGAYREVDNIAQYLAAVMSTRDPQLRYNIPGISAAQKPLVSSSQSSVVETEYSLTLSQFTSAVNV